MAHNEMLLVVSSSQILMEITKKKLERAGYAVRCAVEFAEVRERISDLAPDGIVLLSDFQDGKGLELCRELRKANSIPIIYTSNNKDDELPALQAGANDFLKKPFDYEILTARVEIMLNSRVGLKSKTREQNNFFNDDGVVDVHDYSDQATAEPQAAIKKNSGKVFKRRIRYIVAAACLIVAIIAAGIIIALDGGGGYTELTDVGIPLAEMPFEVED